MLVSYKLLPIDCTMSCRLEEHIIDNQTAFNSQQTLNNPSDIQEAMSLEITNKIRQRFETNDQTGMVEQINSLILLVSNPDLNTFPGFLENEIPEIFYDILSRDNLELTNLIFSLIVKLQKFQDIFQHFLTQDYVNLLADHLKKMDSETFSYDLFLYLKNILMFSQGHDNANFLIDNSIIEMICDHIKNTRDTTFINTCLDILISFASIHLENEKVIHIFDAINFILDDQISRSCFIEKTFQLLNNLFISDSMIFDLFEQSGFIELVQAHLNSPNEITTYYACLLISHIYTKTDCKYQFHMRKLLQIYYEDSKSSKADKCSMAASIALSAQLISMPHLARILMNENTFQNIFILAQRKSLLTKISIVKVLLCLVKESTKENFWKVFAIGPPQQLDIFTFLSELVDINHYSLRLSLKLILQIFLKSENFDVLSDCKTNFLNAFSQKFFEKAELFDDEETVSNFQTLRNYF